MVVASWSRPTSNASSSQQRMPAHPWSFANERTYRSRLGSLRQGKPTVWAECLLADPLADIAVLGSPDNQAFGNEAEAYDALLNGVTRPFPIGRAPKERIKRLKLGG